MFQLKEPWDEPVNAKAFEIELDRELHPSRFLYQFKGQFRAIAKNESNDDVIFEIKDRGFVLVHLTWSNNEPNEDYPKYKMLAQVSDINDVIDNDNLGY